MTASERDKFRADDPRATQPEMAAVPACRPSRPAIEVIDARSDNQRALDEAMDIVRRTLMVKRGEVITEQLATERAANIVQALSLRLTGGAW